MDEDLDRLRGQDDGRPALEEPVLEHKASTRLAWVGLVVLLLVVAASLWLWAPRTSDSPAESVGRVPAEPVASRP